MELRKADAGLLAGAWLFYAVVGLVTGADLALVLVLSTAMAVGTFAGVRFLEAKVGPVRPQVSGRSDASAISERGVRVGVLGMLIGAAALTPVAIAIDQPALAALFAVVVLWSSWRLATTS